MKYVVLIAALIGLGGAALAHQGAMGAVKVRMDAMVRVQDDTKILGNMVRGRADFDADAARAALDRLVEEAQMMPAHFTERDLTAPSEAMPAIWDNFADFEDKADAMAIAAQGPATSLDELRATFTAMGATCGACHEIYRE